MERLNRFLARAGVASRRAADIMIQSGRITVNGTVVDRLGIAIDPLTDRVAVDGGAVEVQPEYEYWIMNKPPGYLSTVRDPFGRPTVMELLPQRNTRLYPVGRLDLDTSGLLFFTNDGEMALALTHPRHLVEKTYRVEVAGVPDRPVLLQLASGVILEDGITAPAKVVLEKVQRGNAILGLTIREGRKRQIKRMMKAVGHPVRSLHRLAVGPLVLGDLKPGECRRPSVTEMEALFALKQQVMVKSR